MGFGESYTACNCLTNCRSQWEFHADGKTIISGQANNLYIFPGQIQKIQAHWMQLQSSPPKTLLSNWKTHSNSYSASCISLNLHWNCFHLQAATSAGDNTADILSECAGPCNNSTGDGDRVSWNIVNPVWSLWGDLHATCHPAPWQAFPIMTSPLKICHVTRSYCTWSWRIVYWSCRFGNGSSSGKVRQNHRWDDHGCRWSTAKVDSRGGQSSWLCLSSLVWNQVHLAFIK